MNFNLIDFIKENKWWVLGAAAFMILMIIYIFNAERGAIKPIPTPFNDQNSATVTIGENFESFSESIDVYEGEVMREEQAVEFFESLGINLGIPDVDLETYGRWDMDDGFVSYDSYTGVGWVKVDSGLRLELEKESSISTENVESLYSDFKTKYLKEFPETVIYEVEECGSGCEGLQVSAVYTVDKSQAVIASPVIGQFALKVSFSELGDLTSLKFLGLMKIDKSQTVNALSIRQMRTYLNQDGFPKRINFEVSDPEFLSQPASVRTSFELESVTVNNSYRVWYYFDSDYKYIVPSYYMTGVAQAYGSYNQSFDADVELIVCAVHPSQLFRRKVAQQTPEPIYIEELGEDETIEEDDKDMLFDTTGFD